MKKIKTSTLVTITISLLLLLAGIFLGDLEEGIMQKAINICYECIGIG